MRCALRLAPLRGDSTDALLLCIRHDRSALLRTGSCGSRRLSRSCTRNSYEWNDVKYFMDAGGLDREAAEGEAAGAASSPSQKISYITGKWQIMRLLGRYRDSQGENFRLGAFHDQLIS